MTEGMEIPSEDPRGELGPEAWAIYTDLATRYVQFIESEGAAAARDKAFDELNEQQELDLPKLAVWYLNHVSDFAAYSALRAVAAHLAERSGT